MLLLILGVFVIFLLVVIATLFIVNYNNYQVAIIKISEAEENIKILLSKKFEQIVLICGVIEDKNKKIKIIDNNLNQKLNSFELSKELEKYNKKIVEVVDYNKEVTLNEEERKMMDELKDLNIELDGNEKYYNDNVVNYNKLIKCFPSNIVGKICKYKTKNFYSKEKEEIFEILKK